MKLFQTSKYEHQTTVYLSSEAIWWTLISIFGLCVALAFALPFVHAVTGVILNKQP